MNKEVIFVVNKLHGGGAERVLTLISSYLAEQDLKVTICTYSDIEEAYIINKNINYVHVKADGKCKQSKKVKRILALRNIFKQNPNATIIAFEYFINIQTVIASLFLKNKVIVSERNDPNMLNSRKIMNILRSISYGLADILVCQTDDAKSYFNSRIQKKAVIIKNPIMSNLPNRFIGNRKKEIVTFCRLEPQKNLKMMIDAFILLSKDYGDYTLSIYGDGSEKNKLKEYVENKGISHKVNFYGFNKNIHKEILKSKMYISSSNYEGLSNSMIEAMAIGLPSVVTDCPCGGARMVIDNNQNGLLVPVGDVNSLYKGMKRIIEDKDFEELLSKNATLIRDELSVEKICSKWIELL